MTRRLYTGGRIPWLYKWSRDAATFVQKQRRFADDAPRDWQDCGIPYHCVFKINHEIASPTSTRPDGLELVIEAKMRFTREQVPTQHHPACQHDGRRDWQPFMCWTGCTPAQEFYCLHVVPLRGTDVWRVLTAFIAELGEPSSLTIPGVPLAAGDMPARAASSFALVVWWSIPP